MADINYFFDETPFVKSRNEFQSEEHYSSACCYKYLYNWVIRGTYISIKIFIRICVCGRFTNRNSFSNRTTIHFSEVGDGVEAHFNDSCTFQDASSNQGKSFRKKCYCQRPFATALR